MNTSIPVRSHDPCLPIQMDLSSMLDGELDAATVRRVMVHSDVCPSCSTFLTGIRDQAWAHRELSHNQILDGGENVAVAEPSPQTQELRRRLLENQHQLAKILYELGRGFVLMGLDPNFSRVVAREPVPIPDMCMRGRSLLDEVQRMNGADQMSVGGEWVRAQELFRSRANRDPMANLAKGKRLLRETLMLRADYHEARIYLGHAYHVEEKHDRAMREFGRVLRESQDLSIRAFALENLGNLHLEQGRPLRAVPYFHELVDSGVIEKEPCFHTSYFNLALAYGLMEKFSECESWLCRLDEEFPHKRRLMAMEFSTRRQFAEALARNAEASERFATRFPFWFPAVDVDVDVAAEGEA